MIRVPFMALLILIFTRLAMLWAIVTRPPRVHCPAQGWSVCDGVQPSGEFVCCAPLTPDGCEDGSKSTMPCDDQAKVRGEIYCTGRSVPIVVDERTVGCQQPH